MLFRGVLDDVLLQEKIEEQLSGNFPTPYDSYVEPGA